MPHLLVETDAIVESSGLFARSESGFTAFYLDGYEIEIGNARSSDGVTVDGSVAEFGLDLETGCPQGYRGCGAMAARFMGALWWKGWRPA